MIKTANAHGHTVYSDVDFSFYLPDGTSVPENSRKRLEAVVRHQQEQIFDGGYEAVVNILQEEANNPPDATKISKYLSNVHSRVMIFLRFYNSVLINMASKSPSPVKREKTLEQFVIGKMR